jgi:hypothetical protein
VRLERLEPEVARAAVLGIAQAPVAPAVGLAHEVDLAVAQDHPRHHPAVLEAVPGEAEHASAEHANGRLRSAHGALAMRTPSNTASGAKRVAEAEPDLVEVDLAARGLLR